MPGERYDVETHQYVGASEFQEGVRRNTPKDSRKFIY